MKIKIKYKCKWKRCFDHSCNLQPSNPNRTEKSQLPQATDSKSGVGYSWRNRRRHLIGRLGTGSSCATFAQWWAAQRCGGHHSTLVEVCVWGPEWVSRRFLPLNIFLFRYELPSGKGYTTIQHVYKTYLAFVQFNKKISPKIKSHYLFLLIKKNLWSQIRNRKFDHLKYNKK